MIVSFGSFAFKTGYSRMLPITGLERKLAVDKEDQDQDGGKPATLVKGVALEQLSFKCKLLRIFPPTPESVIAKFEQLIASRTPERLLIGGKVVGKNKWLLTECAISYSHMDARGKLVEAELSLSFSEFIREGTKKEKSGAASAPGVKPSFGASDAYKANPPTVDEKAATKRPSGKQLRME